MWMKFFRTGLSQFPKITLIENKMKVDEMVTVRDITLTSTREHHFVTIDGKATVAYISRKTPLSGYRKLTALCSSLPSARRFRNV